MRRYFSAFAIVALSAAALAACGKSGGGSPVPPVNPTPTPIAHENLYVAEGGLNQVAVLDAKTGALLKTIPVGKAPAKMSYDREEYALWVANAGSNSVTKIDLNTQKVLGTAAVGTDPEWIDASHVDTISDVVAVANRGSNTVTLLQAGNMSVVQTISTSGAPLTVDAYANMVAEDNGRLVFFEDSPPSPNSTAAFTVTNGLQGAVWVQDDNFQDHILAYTAYDGKVSQYAPIASSGPYTNGLSPEGTYQLPAGAGQIYSIGNGAIVVNDVTNQISSIDFNSGKVDFTTKVGSAPGGVAYGGDLYVANRGDDTVSVVDIVTGKVTNTFKLAAGAHPEDVFFQFAETPVTPTPSPSPSSTPGATQHLYVANGSGGNVLEYTSPFSASSAPAVNLNVGGNIWGVASDSKYVAVEDSTGYIYIFNQPLSASASPVAQFQTVTKGAQVYFDSSGNLYSATQGSGVLEYSPPFSNSTTPVKTIFGDTSSFSLAMDYNDNLYVGNLGMNQIDVFAPPYTGAPTSVAQPGTYGLASYATYLYGADASTGKIDVYNLPLSTSSTPAFTIANTDPHALAADISTGTLYVGDQHGGSGSGSIDVYSQPLSASSTAAYSITSGVKEPVQVWIGP